MNANGLRDILDVRQMTLDLDELIAHAHKKRAVYPWNDWGRRMSYSNLTAGGATLVDHWPDPAFNQDGEPDLWLRAEVWRHLDGTHYRALLHDSGAVVVEPLECCARHDSAEVGESLAPPANEDGWIDAALMSAYEDGSAVPDAD